MNLPSFRSIYLLLFLVAALGSCVTKKKFDDMSARKSKLDLDLAECERVMAQVQAQRKTLEEQLEQMMQMGMEEGLKEAVGQMDGILAEHANA